MRCLLASAGFDQRGLGSVTAALILSVQGASDDHMIGVGCHPVCIYHCACWCVCSLKAYWNALLLSPNL